MKKTYCNKCIFSKEVTSGDVCEFNIPELIKQDKKLSIIDNFYCIEDYTCLYGFGKEQYSLHYENLKNIDIKELIKEKTNLKYYLLIDAREISESILQNIIDELNNLVIRPKKVSIFVNPYHADSFYKIIQKQLSCEKWTIHVFINDLSFNNCLNIILDTNLQTANSWCVIFYDAKLYNKDINDTINSIYTKIILKQESAYGIKKEAAGLHKLCLNSSVYKFVTSVLANDILKGLSLEPNIVLGSYE